MLVLQAAAILVFLLGGGVQIASAAEPVCRVSAEQLAGCADLTVPMVYAGSQHDLLSCSTGSEDAPNISYFDPHDCAAALPYRPNRFGSHTAKSLLLLSY